MAGRILFYKDTDGSGVIASVDGPMIKTEWVMPAGAFAQAAGGFQEWSLVAGLGNNRVFFYNTLGNGLLGYLGPQNIFDNQTPVDGFARDWTQITGLSRNRVLFYSPSYPGIGDNIGRTLVGSFGVGTQTLTQLVVVDDATDWTQITGLTDDRILFYSAADGRIEIAQFLEGSIPEEEREPGTTGDEITSITAVPPASLPNGGPWTCITAIDDVILFYKQATGSGRLMSLTNNELTPVGFYPDGTFDNTWTAITWIRPPQ